MVQCNNPVVTIDVSKILGERYVPVLEDISRTIVIQIIVQFLMSAIDGDPFFSGSFWLVLMYVLIGTVSYHLIVKNMIHFV